MILELYSPYFCRDYMVYAIHALDQKHILHGLMMQISMAEHA